MMQRKPTTAFVYVLGAYVLIQFVWWGYHLIDLTRASAKDPDAVSDRVLMIVGEGSGCGWIGGACGDYVGEFHRSSRDGDRCAAGIVGGGLVKLCWVRGSLWDPGIGGRPLPVEPRSTREETGAGHRVPLERESLGVAAGSAGVPCPLRLSRCVEACGVRECPSPASTPNDTNASKLA